jgi:lysophospholipase L1-like esterase
MGSRRRTRLLLAGAGLVVALAAAEIGLRVFTPHPTHTDSNKVADEALGHRVDPGMPGIDASGFRNPEVLERADIVALGDSHTYGVSASPAGSWPRQLSALTGRSVYNLGLPGYGVLQYRHLMDRALALDPQQVVLAVYPANDFFDVYELIELEHWKPWARAHGLEPYRVVTFEPDWYERLCQRSAILSFLNQATRRSRSQRALGDLERGLQGDVFVVKEPPNDKLIELNRLRSHREKLDTDNASIRAAFDAALTVVAEMHAAAEVRDVAFGVLLVPTMENAFYDFLLARDYDLPPVFHATVAGERRLFEELAVFLGERGIAYTSALPRLAAALETGGPLYAPYDQGHPLAAGYAAYAQAVSEDLLR